MIPEEGTIAAVLSRHSKGSRPQPRFVDVEWVCSCGNWTGPKVGPDPDPYGWEEHLQAELLAALPHLRVQETPADGLRDALQQICDDYAAIDVEMLQETLAAHPAPGPRPVVDREALGRAIADELDSEGIVSYGLAPKLVDAVAALLPTEEDTKGAKCRCTYPDDAHCPVHGDEAGRALRKAVAGGESL